MSASSNAIDEVQTGRSASFLWWALVGFGSFALITRRLAIGVPDARELFVFTLCLVGVASVAAPIRVGIQRLNRSIVLAIGVAAFVGSASLVDSRAPLAHGLEMLILNSLAAVCEEAFFRRLVYGGLVRYGAIAAVTGSAFLFALVHVPLYGPAVFFVDLGAGLVLSWQRWASGDWGASAATHVTANLLAVLR
jgi:membrane protease YdiL (CAAX protease family)